MADLNTMTAKELQEGGYLQEVNRRFFHPLGLALAVNVDAGEDADGYMSVQVWDYRDDPEGFFFVEETLDQGVEKIEKIDSELEAKAKVRIQVAGSVIQEPGVKLAEGEIVS